ncbi:MAG: sigma-70 family RNA polymerase sigma factor [Planctomycetales bacterium]|nr:sigma-70 family RNA polymerase sigma factor [Planctomycetales bacterium]
MYGPLIAHWSRLSGLDHHAAADCVQQTFTAVLRSLNGCQARKLSGSFRSWLWTIASNKIRDHRRSSRREASGVGGSTALQALQQLPMEELSEEVLTDAEPVDAEQLSALVARAREQIREEFAPRTWEIFSRAVVDQIPTAMVAQEFSVTPAAVRQARSRILRRLRQQLGDIEP